MGTGEETKFKIKMKTLRMFGALLLTCVMCLNFVACDDDNENEPSLYFTADELVGTVWSGTNKAQDNYEIKIVNRNHECTENGKENAQKTVTTVHKNQ